MRRRSLIALSIVGALLLALVAGAWAYDRGRQDTVAPGVSVGGVDLGGLNRSEARAKLQRELLSPLRRPIVVRHKTRSWELTARQARISADVNGSVEAALERGRDGNFLVRTWRDVTGTAQQDDVSPRLTYSDAAVRRLITRVRKAVDRPARDASVTFTGSSVAPVASRTGKRVRYGRLHNQIRAAILSPTADRTFTARTKTVQPKVTTSELGRKYPTLITVDRANFRLTLFKNLKPVKSYPIAVGMAGLETPAGLYAIQDKQVNPSWHVPNSAWAGDLAGQVIPPGPSNPIKARWMGIAAGAGIHGTSDIGSLGSAASHGCVRMAISDVEDLYDRVAVGTPVYIA